MWRKFFIALLLLAPIAMFFSFPRDLHLTLFFDHVKGLQAGDGVYLDGLRIGEVRQLEFAGRRVAVHVEIENRYADAIPADSHFLLWQDELDPERRSIRVLAGRRRNSLTPKALSSQDGRASPRAAELPAPPASPVPDRPPQATRRGPPHPGYGRALQ